PQSQGERQLIRVLLGPQGDFFGAAEKLSFFTQTWQVSKDSDRMGYRLEGEALHHLDKKEIVSDGVMKGAIQVPGHGQPIVLLADAQTTGGYPKIATVIGPDLGKFAYFSAGNRLRFQEVSYEAALQARRDRNAQYAAIKNWLAGQTTPTSHLYRISVKGEVFTVRVDEKLE
ncbi:MAG: KipI antagonist, partial [Candidatus Riflebacteria bacterium]|nr:KipI antagonist [Candidatus Riflebacteria bacterium]